MQRIRLLAVVIACLMSVKVEAQEAAPTLNEQKEAMDKLERLVGEWTGSGWIEMGPRRFEFSSSEVFAKKAGGLAIIVEGMHWMPQPDGEKRVVHNAVAMINYDAKAKRYRFITQLANGRTGDFQATFTEDGHFQWTIPDTPAGKMTYTIMIEDDQYRERGEIVTSSGEAKQFFEMKLRRLGLRPDPLP